MLDSGLFEASMQKFYYFSSNTDKMKGFLSLKIYRVFVEAQ